MLITLLVDHVTFAGRTHAAGEAIEVDEAFGLRLLADGLASEAESAGDPPADGQPDEPPAGEPTAGPDHEPIDPGPASTPARNRPRRR